MTIFKRQPRIGLAILGSFAIISAAAAEDKVAEDSQQQRAGSRVEHVDTSHPPDDRPHVT